MMHVRKGNYRGEGRNKNKDVKKEEEVPLSK